MTALAHTCPHETVSPELARLQATVGEHGWASNWLVMQADLRTFLRDWAEKAAVLGWADWELYGMAAAPASWDRIDLMGLVPLLRGRRIIEMTQKRAVIDAGEGARLSHYRRTGGR